MSKLSEYAETIVRESFRRQLDQEESAARSLPFVIAAAALTGNVLTTVKPQLHGFDPHSRVSLILYSSACLMAVCGVVILIGLLMAIWRRRYDYPIDEVDFLGFAQSVATYYTTLQREQAAPAHDPDHEDAGRDADEAALADVREDMTRRFAVATRAHRRSNRLRALGRDLALHGTVLFMVLTVVMVAMIYIRQVWLRGG